MVVNESSNTRREAYDGVSDSSTSFNYGFNTNVPGTSGKSFAGNNEEDECAKHLQGCTFTREQYNQILQMLKQNKGTANTGNAAQAHGVQAHEVQTNAAGKAILVSENNDVWIIDTGATNHMISKIGMLNKESVVEVKCPKPVSLPNGEVAYVTHTGSCHISPTIIVTDVFHIPECKYNLCQ
uniref:Putative ovule protein n=1 Tax=Solanum chacoense TaxID=4108 RepID=A0A0V0HAX4_SOLCH